MVSYAERSSINLQMVVVFPRALLGFLAFHRAMHSIVYLNTLVSSCIVGCG